jgi:hypothetical protein
MKYAITEKDPGFIRDFGAFLITLGCTKLDDTTYESQIDLDLSDFHGIGPVLEDGADFHAEHPFLAEMDWLQKYTGNFAFLLSLKAQLARKGDLSDAQWVGVAKCMARETQSATPAPARVYSIKAGQVLVVGKWIAKKIANEAGLTKPHYTMEVTEVHGETERAVFVTVKLSAQRTSHCGCCGKSLTDPNSIAAGIGPICADKWGVSFGGSSLVELAEALKVTVPVKTWIPKVSIKNFNDEKVAA